MWPHSKRLRLQSIHAQQVDAIWWKTPYKATQVILPPVSLQLNQSSHSVCFHSAEIVNYALHPSKLLRVDRTFKHIYLDTQKPSCWMQSYDPTNSLPSPYKMIYKVVLMRLYNVKHDINSTMWSCHTPTKLKRKSRLRHALYPKCLRLTYHMTFKHIHFTTYKMPSVDVVWFNRSVMTELDLIRAYLT